MNKMDYFAQQGFVRLFAAAKKKYESLGRIGGSIRLTRLEEEEKRAISGLLGRNLDQGSVTIKLQELEDALTSSRYEIDLLAILRFLYQGEVKPKSVLQQEKIDAWQQFVKQLIGGAEQKETIAWLEQIREGVGLGHRTLREIFDERVDGRNLDDVAEISDGDELNAVIRALDRLPIRFGKVQPLPVFAAQISADPHFLDRDRRMGRLFYYGLLAYIAYHGDLERDKSESKSDGDECAKINSNRSMAHEQPINSFQVRKQYWQVGLKLDALSSQVLVVDVFHQPPFSFGITLETVEQYARNLRESCSSVSTSMEDSLLEEGADHSGQGFHSHPLHLFVQHALQMGMVYVSENPAICSAVIDFIQQKQNQLYRDKPSPLFSPLICTSGQPSVAALLLLDLLTSQGVKIHYSGDLDVKGMEMAIALQKRYPTNWHPWGMTAEDAQFALNQDHHNHGTEVPFTAEERKNLKQLSATWDSQLVATLLEGGQKIYQEMMVERLLERYELS